MHHLNLRTLLLGGALLLSPAVSAQFADAVVSYIPGTGFATEFGTGAGYTNALAALGEPSRVTPGSFGGPVDPFNPPFLKEQLLSIGANGSLTVSFAEPVTNNPANPFGIDFIVFGNAGFIITNGNFSGGGITDGSLFSANDGEVRVSVSSDNVTYYALSPSSSTAGGYYPADGTGDFRIPVDPAISTTSLSGSGLARLRQLYAGSGGGSGYDLATAHDASGNPVALESIRYARVEVFAGHTEIDGFSVAALPGIDPRNISESFLGDASARGWITLGDSSLFGWNSQNPGVNFTWDSSRSNSYYALPLGMTLTRADDFLVRFTFTLVDIAIGSTPEKPYTFQIAAGLMNLTNAVSPNLARGSGIHPLNGARNLVEWTYFPDSGFGATVGPSLVSKDNHLLFSDNHPLPLEPGVTYRVEMQFNPVAQELTTRMWANGEPFGLEPGATINALKIPASFSDFGVNAFAISSYSDAGQDPRFAGSILAHGAVHNVEVTVYNRPPLAISVSNSGLTLAFPTEAGWHYFIEQSTDTVNWSPASETAYTGTGLEMRAELPAISPNGIFRVRAERN